MKKIILMISILFLVTGCFKRDNFENATIYTTVYPIEYITNYLYGESSTILSIYPKGEDFKNYKLNDKQINDYSNSDLYIYNGLSNESDYAIEMLEYNKIKLIDSTMGMDMGESIEELWLNPSDMIMIASNVKNGLFEYIENPYLEKEIQDKYDELKIIISNLDVQLHVASATASNKLIITSDKSFNYLTKYGFEVLCLEESEELLEKDIVTAIDLLKKKTVKYIYLMENEEKSKTINRIIKDASPDILYLDKMNVVKSDELEIKDYIDISLENIDKIKQGL
ncbi:MAG: metal ABC transporter substrate-binding protein [Bacilli bacterium]